MFLFISFTNIVREGIVAMCNLQTRNFCGFVGQNPGTELSVSPKFDKEKFDAFVPNISLSFHTVILSLFNR